jgi:hypothetical protein
MQDSMQDSLAHRSEYICDMARELAAMARADGLAFLAYVLEIAVAEAETQNDAAESQDEQIDNVLAQARHQPPH